VSICRWSAAKSITDHGRCAPAGNAGLQRRASAAGLLVSNTGRSVIASASAGLMIRLEGAKQIVADRIRTVVAGGVESIRPGSERAHEPFSAGRQIVLTRAPAIYLAMMIPPKWSRSTTRSRARRWMKIRSRVSSGGLKRRRLAVLRTRSSRQRRPSNSMTRRPVRPLADHARAR
jgi:hypothetical protein